MEPSEEDVETLLENDSFTYQRGPRTGEVEYQGVRIGLPGNIYEDYRWKVLEDLSEGARLDRVLQNVYSDGTKAMHMEPYSELGEVLDEGFLWREDRRNATELIEFEKQRRDVEEFKKPEGYSVDAYIEFVENAIGK